MRTWLLALSLAVLVVAGLVAAELFRGFEFSDRYSAYRAGRLGAKALYLTLDELGWPVARLQEPPARAGHRGTLFLLLDAAAGAAFPPEDAVELLDWVAQGNQLVLAHEGEVGLLERLEVEVVWGEGAEGEEPLYRIAAGAEVETFHAVGPITMRRPGRYALTDGYAAVGWRGPRGPAIVAVPRGEGLVVLVSDPWVFSNAGLAEPGNLDLALTLAGSGKVAFDELHHGFSASRSVMGWMRRRGLTPLLAQGGLIALVLVLALRGRREARLRRPAARGPGSGDFLQALARIYAAAGFRRDAVIDLTAALRRGLQRELRMPREDDRAAVARLAGRHPALAGEIAQLLADCAIAPAYRKDSELVAWHNRVAAALRAVEGAVRGRGSEAR